MSIITIDFETRSPVDLRKTSAWVYAENPATSILCIAWKKDNDPARVLTRFDRMPSQLMSAIVDEECLFEAHNAEFERAIWHHILHKRHGWPDVPIRRWRCSAAKAAAFALPRSLGDAGDALALDIQKDKEGHALMLKMCKPRAPRKKEREQDPCWASRLFWWEDGTDLERLYEYCKQDVESEAALSDRLRPLSEYEQTVWELDQTINTRGVCIDTGTVRAAIGLISTYSDALLTEMQELTHGLVDSPKQVAKTIDWLATRGCISPDLKKDTVSQLLSQKGLQPDVRRVLEIRQSLSKASTAKYEAMLNRVNTDGRARGLFMYHGASTGRWAGKGIQPHNLPRGSFHDTDLAIDLIQKKDIQNLEFYYGDPMDVLSTCLRPMISAAPGHDLLCADFSAIEGRVLAWIAGEQHIIQDYTEGKDPYKAAAARILNKPYDDVTKEERQMPGKVAELACGYQGGPAAARRFGATGTDEEIRDTIIDPWRDNRSCTVAFWNSIEYAAKKAVSTGRVMSYQDVKFGVHEGFLHCKLPSGRLLSYYDPRLETVRAPWGRIVHKLTFMGMNAVTHNWERQTTYGGKLTENIVQAIARDILAEAMLTVEAHGYPIVMHIHDEIVAEVHKQEGDLEEFCNLMAVSPPWLSGCPIKADGWRGERYRKD